MHHSTHVIKAGQEKEDKKTSCNKSMWRVEVITYRNLWIEKNIHRKSQWIVIQSELFLIDKASFA